MELTLKEIIKDNVVNFYFYRAGNLFYSITVEDKTYMFPVPIEDIGDATFLKTDKAIIFMRYIRKAMLDNSFVLAI